MIVAARRSQRANYTTVGQEIRWTRSVLRCSPRCAQRRRGSSVCRCGFRRCAPAFVNARPGWHQRWHRNSATGRAKSPTIRATQGFSRHPRQDSNLGPSDEKLPSAVCRLVSRHAGNARLVRVLAGCSCRVVSARDAVGRPGWHHRWHQLPIGWAGVGQSTMSWCQSRMLARGGATCPPQSLCRR